MSQQEQSRPRRFERSTTGALVCAAALAAAAFPLDRFGVGIFVGAVAVAASVLAGRPRKIDTWEVVYGGLALLLAAMAVLRDAEWIVVPCLLMAAALGSLAAAGGETFAEVAAGMVSFAGRLHLICGSLAGSFTEVTSSRPRSWAPVLRGLTASVVLVLVFGALFFSADAVFAQLASRIIPDFDVQILGRLTAFTLALGYGAATILSGPRYRGAAFAPVLVAGRHMLAAYKQGPRGADTDWKITLSAVTGLFAAFVAVQITVLFGGHRHVLETAGLTYSEYARRGFLQLLAVGVLTLAVLGAARTFGSWQPGRDRRAFSWLATGLIALTLVILASAFYRLSLYEEAFGFTRARLAAHAVAVWLAGIFVLVLLSLSPAAGRYLARLCTAFTAAALLMLCLYNPDARIAEANIERFRRTGRLDAWYLGGLSSDAASQLAKLPDGTRDCVLRDPGADSWRSFNLSRRHARQVVRSA